MAFKDYSAPIREHVSIALDVRIREAEAAQSEISEAISMISAIPYPRDEHVSVYITRLHNRAIQLSKFIRESKAQLAGR